VIEVNEPAAMMVEDRYRPPGIDVRPELLILMNVR